MGTNALGQKTIPVIANRRMSYHERLVVPGERFECDEVQAKAWLKNGAVTLVQERPKFNEPPAPPVDPVVAKVLEAEKEPEPQPVQAASPVTLPNALAPAQQHPTGRGRYDRRDMRPKSS